MSHRSAAGGRRWEPRRGTVRASLLPVLLVAAAGAAGWMPGTLGAASPAEEPPASRHPAGEYLTVNGARLWVESEGQGPPVILIAGGPGLDHGYFHPYFTALASRFRVIYYDAFGRGRSDRAKSPGEYTFSRDVEDLEGLRKALGLSKVSLYGHSYGGLVALAYAFAHPGAVDKVAVANGIFSGRMWQESDDNANREIRERLPAVWAKVQELRAQGLRSCSPAHQEAYRLPPGFYWHRRPRQPPQLGSNNDVYCAILGQDADFVIGGEVAGLDFVPRLKELRAPLLVLAGLYDNIALVRFAREVAKQAPRASVVELAESGHFSFIEEHDRTIELLTGVFARR